MTTHGVVCGRAAERHVLDARVDELRRGDGAVVLVTGAAGMGKSLLLAGVRSAVEERGIAVLAGASRELEHTRPFGVFVDALRGRRSHPDVGALLDLVQGDGIAENRYVVQDRLLDLIEASSLDAPLALILDDVQWIDAASLAVLHRLAALASEVPLLLVVGSRPSASLDRLRLLTAHHVELEPLGPDDVAELAGARTGRKPGPRLLALLGSAGGNPLFVHELLHALERDGLLRASDDAIESDADAVPTSARQAILSRLTFLSEDALEVMRTAAVLGTTFAVSDVVAVLGRPASAVYPWLDEGRRAGLVGDAESAEAFRFQHDIVHDAIYTDLPLTARQAMHLDAGRALAAVGAPAGQVAAHMALGARRGDEAAIRWVAKAAAHASTAAPAVAADLLDQLVALLEVDDPRRAVALADLGFSRIWSGQLDLAERAVRILLDTATRPDDLARADRVLGRILTTTSRHDAALANAEHAAGRDGLAPQERAQQLAELAYVTTFVNPDRGVAVGEHAIEAAIAAGSHSALGRAYGVRALDCYLRGYFADSLAFAAKVREEAIRARTNLDATNAYFNLVARGYDGDPFDAMYGHYGCDDIRRAVDIGTTMLHAYAAAGVREMLPFAHSNLSFMRFGAGEWDEAIADAETGLALMHDLGIVWQSRFMAASLCVMLTLRGRSQDAQRSLAAADAAPGIPMPAYEVTFVEWARATMLAAAGDVDAAVLASDRGWEAAVAVGSLGILRVVAADRARLLLAVGRRPDDVVEIAEELRDRTPASRAGSALVDHCRGLVDGEPERALAAAEVFFELHFPVDAMFAFEDAGTLLARRGDTSAAVHTLNQASELADGLGAVVVTQRVGAQLRRLGVRRGARGERRRPATGWGALTEGEHRVVELAATGLTNRQVAERLYVSSRTVESHLASVYRKLAVSTRAELAAQFAAAASS